MTNIERVAEKAILNVIAFFYKPFRKIIPPTFFRYGFSGGANMVFDWILYFVFYNSFTNHVKNESNMNHNFID